MQNGKNFPVISEESVQRALDALVLLSRPRSSNPLQFLLCVDLFLANPDLPPLRNDRQSALDIFLVNTITEQYRVRRSLFDLPDPQPEQKIDLVMAALAADMQFGGHELLAWSWLYHHYVRVDLNISHSEFTKATGITDRTLRRYQQIAVRRLKEHLTQIEWSARREHRRRRLYTEFPRAGRSKVIGRSAELDFVRRALATSQIHHILISGPPGIGKSTFIEEILKWQVEEALIDRIVWVDDPQSSELVELILRERLLVSESRISLRDYLALYRACIVLDDIFALRADKDALKKLLEYLSNALVIMSSRTQDTFTDCVHLALSELNYEDSYRLISETFQSKYGIMDTPTDDDISALWNKVGGNPSAIKLAFRNIPAIALSSSSDLAIVELFREVYSQLDLDTKYVWCLFALLPATQVNTRQLLEAWPTIVQPKHLATLVGNCIMDSLDIEQNIVFMHTAARNLIMSIYQSDSETRVIVNRICIMINDMGENLSEIQFMMVENLLSSPWIILDSSQRLRWLRSFWRRGVNEEHWGRWAHLLGKYSSSDDFELQVAYGICLRCLSKWDTAQHTFSTVIETTGRVGAFTDQCVAMTELGILLRLRGDYRAAHELLAHAELVANRYHLETTMEAIKMERAQVALDLQERDEVLRILATLSESPRVLLMWAELYLVQHDSIRSREFCQRLLGNYHRNPSVSARIHVLLGRTYQQENNVDKAIEQFGTAQSILERNSNDPFALARVQSNLGGLLATIGYQTEARNYLKQAEQTQMSLKDRVGLASTRHNIRLLNRQFPS
jgi:tetratricopeptide (TPR) repeat protein